MFLSHGRDNHLRVWQLGRDQEAALSRILPVDDSLSERASPWLRHSLLVNALNFCAFAQCEMHNALGTSTELLVAVPGIKEGEVAIYTLPSEGLHSYIKLRAEDKTGQSRSCHIIHRFDITGMIMSLRMFVSDTQLTLLAGYETGAIALMKHTKEGNWTQIWTTKQHAQPLLSLDISCDYSMCLSSGADALVSRYQIKDAMAGPNMESINTKHSGQQSLRVRDDGRLFATAGWDGAIRVYSCATLQELAVLKWHKQGCSALDFATVIDKNETRYIPTDVPLQPAVIEQTLSGLQKPTLRESRNAQEYSTHWLAAGGKDGKVSLWDIY